MNTPINQTSKALGVWIVEDDPDQADLLTFLFEREGFSVQTFIDGVQCIDYAKDSAIMPDAMIIDLKLPYMSGFEVVAILRTFQNWDTLPILVISARAGSHDIAKAFECGANDYVRKPFDPIEMFARLYRLLQENRKRKLQSSTLGRER